MAEESAMGINVIVILELLGTIGGLITCAALLHKVRSSKRTKRLWGNLKRVTIHRVRFVRGWGYHGDVFYQAHTTRNQQLSYIARVREFITRSEPDFVTVTAPNKTPMPGPLMFTKIHIVWSRFYAQISFTCDLAEAFHKPERFRAISFGTVDENLLATSWSSASRGEIGWEITSKSTRVTIDTSESWRILCERAHLDTLSVQVVGFRGPSLHSVGRFDLAKALDTPAKSWAYDFAAGELFNAVSRYEPTDGAAVTDYLVDAAMGQRKPEELYWKRPFPFGIRYSHPDHMWGDDD